MSESRVRDLYANATAWDFGPLDVYREKMRGDHAAEFDGFIAKVKADALREAAEGVTEIDGRRDDAAATWLNDRADQIEGEA